MSLTSVPFQKSWADELQGEQLKREVAGTSRIEGAVFTEQELDDALQIHDNESVHDDRTRSQRQATAALRTYKWISECPKDYRITRESILTIHRLMITGADDDHCPPGKLRTGDQNVTFGLPRHRGVSGGRNCEAALRDLCKALAGEMTDHHPIIQGLALHYHLAALHPFLDGNGRTARALEALSLQRVGLRDTLFIAMSNYYYEEKVEYLSVLARVRSQDHDLTEFLVFGLRGIETQCARLFAEIKKHIQKALYRNLMYDLFNRLMSPRKRVIADRQIAILNLLLEDEMELGRLMDLTHRHYSNLKNPSTAMVRDLNALLGLRAIWYRHEAGKYTFFVRLEWPSELSETELFMRIERMPTAKTHSFLDH